ncbi:MAG: hypothetical protein HBSAPP03_13910 [Phycisphaerae bacterium]|nr:MAG: hypothetical protein HBSAPP03_13910 [Phycisphaerae bacterium]
MHSCRIISIILSAGSLLVILWNWSCAIHNPQNNEVHSEIDVIGASPTDSNAVESRVASFLTADIREALHRSPVAQEHVDNLVVLIDSIIASMLANDAEPYIKEMNTRGFAVRASIVKLLDQMHEDERVVDLHASNLLPEEIFARMWADATSRDMDISHVIRGSVKVGTGVSARPGADWTHRTGIGMISIFEYRATGRPIASRHGKPTELVHEAWVQYDAIFTSGMSTTLRLTFYFDKDAAHWVPYGILVGAINGHRPYPLI